MYIWDDVISEAEREMLQANVTLNGYGETCALLIVDMNYSFVDSAFPMGAGEAGRPAVQCVGELLAIAREKGLPVFYTTSQWRENAIERGLWKRTPGVNEGLRHPKTYEIVNELKPLPTEPVVIKYAPSAFHGTNLINMLVRNRVDTVILTGMATSGCIYATAMDAFSYGFKVVVPQEGVADRSPTSHKVTLFNIHMKYGDVVKAEDLKKVLWNVNCPAGA